MNAHCRAICGLLAGREQAYLLGLGLTLVQYSRTVYAVMRSQGC